MRSRGLGRWGLPGLIALGVAAPAHASFQAAPPLVTLNATGAKIVVTQAPLAEAIDALARAAGFKVTYEGARPTAMLYNAEIDTPTVAQTLFRLIDGQNLNYAVTFDLTGRRVTLLIVLGVQLKTGGAAGGPAGAARPQPFTPPRGPRTDVPVVDEDPVEAEPEPTPTPVPSPPLPARGGPGVSPFPPSPFGPRPFGSPLGPRPSPSPSP
jgi:hypothetical protein